MFPMTRTRKITTTTEAISPMDIWRYHANQQRIDDAQ